VPDPVIAGPGEAIRAGGTSLVLHEWSGGPHEGPPLHVHRHDDEAWHVLEGTLRFRIAERTVDAGAGTTVFVPAGVAHTFGNPGPGRVRYLIIMTPRILNLIQALHAGGERTPAERRALYDAHDAELLE
jgi:mannose-6-phosphate isomerase-like protein (cupin superfamily)